MRVKHRASYGSSQGNKRSPKGAAGSSKNPRVPVNYQLEPMEPRMLLSVTLPANWIAHPALSPFYPSATTGSANPVGASPDEITRAYGMNNVQFQGITGDGTGQTVAIIAAYDDPNIAADLATFDTQYNLPAPASLTRLNDQGLTGPLPGTDPAGQAAAQGNWEEEESIDVEWIHAMAPGAAIDLYEASNAGQDLFNTAARAAAANGISVISMGWSGDETANEVNRLDPIFTTAGGHTGIAFVAAAGDYGAYDQGGTTFSPQYPASSPNVISVGGTRGTGANASAWGTGTNSATTGGGGGGISAYESQPSFQTFFASGLSATNRAYPDVAMDAAPQSGVAFVDSYDYTANTPWASTPAGGTSLATALFSGVMAIVDQGRVINGLNTLDSANGGLARIYSLPSADFNDVVNGTNGYAASAGYDLATGRGSPAGPTFATDLASASIGSYVFVDPDLSGTQTAGETTGAANVTVTLYSTVSGAVATTTTDANGFYQFLNEPAGSYFLNFTPIVGTGYVISTQVTNGTAGNENLANPLTGDTPVFTTTATTENVDENAGVYQQTITITSFVSVLRPQSGFAPMVFTVTLAPINNGTVDVPFTTADGSATVANNDYIPNSGVLVFGPGVTSETITVLAVGNTTIENDVSYYVNITQPINWVVAPGGTSIGTGLIQNDNFPVATITGPAPAVRSATNNLVYNFTVNLSAVAPFDVTVDYTTVDGSALAGVDYTTSSGTLDFPAGTTSQTIYVTILPGTNRQLDKTFSVQLSPVSPATATIGTPGSATATILTNFPPAISAANASVTESLSGLAYLPFTVTVTPALTSTVTVDYATSDVTAHAGVDYVAESGTLIFGPGRLTNTVYVPVPQQFIPAQSKTLTFTLSNASGDIIVVNPIATGTINYVALAGLPFSGAQKATFEHKAIRAVNAVYTDALGQRVTVSMKGFGNGEVIFLGSSSVDTNAYEILLDGATTSLSSVTVTVAHRGQTSISDFIDSGSIGTLYGNELNIVSNFSVAGSANILNIGYLESATLTISGVNDGPTTALAFGRVLNSNINSSLPIRTLSSGNYLNTSGSPIYITAPSVGTVRVRGSFGATIQTASVQSINVTGTLSGGVIASSSIGTVTAGGMANATFFAGIVTGVTGLPTVVSDFINPGASIGSIRVRGAFSNSLIAAEVISAVNIGSVVTDPGASLFGLSATQFGTVKTVAGPSRQVIDVTDPVTTSRVDNFVVNFV